MIESSTSVDITECAIPNKDGYMDQILKNVPFFILKKHSVLIFLTYMNSFILLVYWNT